MITWPTLGQVGAPKPTRILGLRADDLVLVATPLLGGVLAGLAFVWAAKGKTAEAQLMLAVWGIIGAFGASAMAFQQVTERERARRA